MFNRLLNNSQSQSCGVIERLGLHRPELCAWALYDLANSAVMTTIIAAIFALFALSEKLAGILGPALFIVVIWLAGSSRYAIVSVIIFFLIGGLLLSRVDVVQGQARIRMEERPDRETLAT